ncbi:FKBP-type peptidyl-prolyl cis-trans isomerase [Nocardiopsis composta]|uniref:peptidylprolyl isomerase n=1 Tax=Nocardiopsis composta TaxID=157465 RepID=A0A7W8QU61_9ACTN|nr:FKBP-type peptidyl-prolyl cis-trans isomerase [Nocardiopsis composta]MBB5435993.1 peptidylprolyl isomerase [Nocardiopsis composta]
MRRRAAALAVPFSVVLLASSACGAIPEKYQVPAFMRMDEEETDSRLPTVEGKPGEEPKVAFPDIAPPGEQISGVVRPGDDEEIIRADDTLLVDIVDYQWTGKGKSEKTNSTYETDTPFLLQLNQVNEELSGALVNQAVGAQVAFVLPGPDPAQAEAQGMEPQEGDTVSVVEVRDRFGKGDTVQGKQQTDGGDGLPTAADAGSAAPEIEIPKDTDPPKKLEKVDLIEGGGPETEKEQQLVVQYTGVRWEDGEMFDSSWKQGGTPFTFPLGQGQVIEGWDKGLEGVKVGSRVMLVIPEDQAYGKEAEENGQPAGTLVFVVDVLGAVNPPPPPEEEGDGKDSGDKESKDSEDKDAEGGEG